MLIWLYNLPSAPAASEADAVEEEAVTKGGLSMSRRRMRELERQQLEAIIRDDDEMIAILGPFLGR